MTPDIITSLVSTLGVVGALVWYLYHNTTKTIPDLTRQFAATQEKISERFASALAEERDYRKQETDKFADTQEKISERFASTLAEERDYRKQEIVALQHWIKSEASCKYNQDRE